MNDARSRALKKSTSCGETCLSNLGSGQVIQAVTMAEICLQKTKRIKIFSERPLASP